MEFKGTVKKHKRYYASNIEVLLEYFREEKNMFEKIISMLENEKKNHDNSKLTGKEFELFSKLADNLKNVEFGSYEYNKNLKKLKEPLAMHYQKNDHHPEHFTNGINDMNLCQVVYMVVDWIASGILHENNLSPKQKFQKSLNICKEKLGIDNQLFNIIANTGDIFF